MNQAGKAQAFRDLHAAGNPLILYNVWDAGTAKAVAEAGAAAVATGSWSLAAAHGYPDGERIPLDLVTTVVSRIVAGTDLPVSVDIEGGYGVRPEEVAATAAAVLATGAVGVNFEDQVVGGDGLYGVAEQADRIAAIRREADRTGVPLFVNARTDLFLRERDRGRHAGLLGQAKDRAAAYGEAGASGFFVPGLVDERLIAEICEATVLPVNVMMLDGAPAPERLAALGVRRVSFGPIPYIAAMGFVRQQAAGQLRR